MINVILCKNKRSCSRITRKPNIGHKVNARNTIVRTYLNNFFKLKKKVSVKNPCVAFTLKNSTNQDLEPMLGKWNSRKEHQGTTNSKRIKISFNCGRTSHIAFHSSTHTTGPMFLKMEVFRLIILNGYCHCIKRSVVCIWRHQKHDYANYDRFVPNFDLACKTIKRVSVQIWSHLA